MIGDSITKNTVSLATLARNRPPPPNASRAAGRVITSITVAIFGANHVTSTRMSTARPLPVATKSEGRSARATPYVPSTMSSDPGRRAEEHQDREAELVAADELEPRQHQEVPVLHVALAPAQVAADELDAASAGSPPSRVSSGSTRTS